MFQLYLTFKKPSFLSKYMVNWGRFRSWDIFFCDECVLFYFIFIYFYDECFFKFLKKFFYCSGFCHTLKWNSHGFTCVPHPDPPSHLPHHLLPLGLPSAPGPSACLMHPTRSWDINLISRGLERFMVPLKLHVEYCTCVCVCMWLFFERRDLILVRFWRLMTTVL